MVFKYCQKSICFMVSMTFWECFIFQLTLLSDEIFAKNIPIFVTVDPISTAILKIDLADSRKIKDWKNHWECLQSNGYVATYLVTDEGKGCNLKVDLKFPHLTGVGSALEKSGDD